MYQIKLKEIVLFTEYSCRKIISRSLLYALKNSRLCTKLQSLILESRLKINNNVESVDVFIKFNIHLKGHP